MELKRFENPTFTSNTYVLSDQTNSKAIVVDIGEYSQAKTYLDTFDEVPWLFITHAHYDHIYHVEEFMEDHPECRIYGSKHAVSAMADSKLNLSFYHEDPVVYRGDDVIALEGGKLIPLGGKLSVEAIATPGHTPGCLSFKIDKFLFSGDSFIPGFEVVTKLRGGDKRSSALSIELIKRHLTEDSVLCPGHGITYLGSDILNTDG